MIFLWSILLIWRETRPSGSLKLSYLQKQIGQKGSSFDWKYWNLLKKIFITVGVTHSILSHDLVTDWFLFLETSVILFPGPKKWRIIKAPPRTYISRYYNIDLTEGSYYVGKYVRKSSNIRKKVDNGLLPRKIDRQRWWTPW